MSFVPFVSRRFFRSRQDDRFISFITLIAILGVMLGSAALIIALSVLGGFEDEITGKVIGFNSHVQILGFQNQPLKHPRETERILLDSIPVIKTVSPFVAREALLRSKDGVDGVLLKGVRPGDDLIVGRAYIVDGMYDLVAGKGAMPKLVLGKKLARRLSLRVGDRAAVFAQVNSGDAEYLRVRQFRITGIYESGMAEYDDILAFTDIADAQSLLRLDNAVSGYDLFLSEPDSASVVAAHAEELLGYPHFARTVFESYRNIFSWIELQKKPVPIILGLIILVATVNIIGTLLMLVLGKTREIGILMSLGSTRSSIAAVFLRQGLTIGIYGTVLGNLLAFLLCFVQQEFRILSLPSDVYFMSTVPILLRWQYFLVVSAVSIALSVLCSLLPAQIASRVDPVRSIRFS